MALKAKWCAGVTLHSSTQSLKSIIKLGGVFRAAQLMSKLNAALIQKLINSELINSKNELLPDLKDQLVPSFSLPEYQTTPLIRALEIEISRWELPFEEGGEGGFIPPRGWPLILGAARLDGLVLSSEDLDPRLKPVQKPVPNIHKANIGMHDLPPPPADPKMREYIRGHYVSTTGSIYPIRRRGRARKKAPQL